MLRVIYIAFALFSIPFLAAGQRVYEMKTLLSEGVRISAFGSFVGGAGPFSGKYTGFMGGDGAVVLNNFYAGIYGRKTMEYHPVYRDDSYYAGKKMGLSQVGLMTGVSFRSKKFFQYALVFHAGWGNLSLRDNSEKKILTRDRINTFIPAIQAKINLTSYTQVCLDVSYQFLAGVDFPQLTNRDFRGVCSYLSLRFGWF
jgi:hypothetical protein